MAWESWKANATPIPTREQTTSERGPGSTRTVGEVREAPPILPETYAFGAVAVGFMVWAGCVAALSLCHHRRRRRLSYFPRIWRW
jgi:hypothetical protein